ncbi:MAG: NAD(+) synthase [SAR324 cluster bacterium]|nr:NAD(+) synthase [SAR324 cluster bacterium]
MGSIKEYGFLRVAAISPYLEVADVEYNTNSIKKLLLKVDKLNVNLAVFPELSLSAYSCGDMFYQASLLNQVLDKLIELKHFSKNINSAFIVGLPLIHKSRLFNTAALISQGKIVGIVAKSYIDNNQEYYEKRWFTAGDNLSDEITIDGEKIPLGSDLIFRAVNYHNFMLGIEICYDLWVPIAPSSKMCLAGALLIANPSASSSMLGKLSYRKKLITAQSGSCVAGYIYAGAAASESTSDMVFDPHLLISEYGKVLAEDRQMSDETKMIYSDMDLSKLVHQRLRTTAWHGSATINKYRFIDFQTSDNFAPEKDLCYRLINENPFIPHKKTKEHAVCKRIIDITAQGLKKRIAYSKVKSLVIGISGGLDSTLALLIAKESLKSYNLGAITLLPVTMPGPGTSQLTAKNAAKLCQLLDLPVTNIPIDKAVTEHLKSLSWNKKGIPFENAQARERMQILMDLANMKNGLVIGTGDLSEAVLGWSTYGGDQISMYHLLGGIPKTLVKSIIAYISQSSNNKALSDVLLSILNTPISPELVASKNSAIPTQKTEQILGPYQLHDFFLFHMLNHGFSPRKIFYLANLVSEIPPAKILRTMKIFYERFFKNQFKRSSMPDSPKVGTIAISPRGDLRMPSDISSKLWQNEITLLLKQNL